LSFSEFLTPAQHVKQKNKSATSRAKTHKTRANKETFFFISRTGKAEREKGYNTHLLDRVFFYCACARRAFEQRFTRVFLSLNKLNVKERERSHLLDFEREIAT